MSEFYPITIGYDDAYPSPDNRAGFAQYGYGGVIGGMYRIGEAEVMEVALHVSSFPSFCGGAWAHSPQVHFFQGTSWGPIIRGRHGFPALQSQEDLESLPDLREQMEGMPRRECKMYGYRILANGLIAWLHRRGKRGVLLTGPVNDPVAYFVEQMQQVRTARLAGAYTSTLRYDRGFGELPPIVSCVPVQVEVEPTREWVNYNSGNECRHFSVIITSDLLGGEEGCPADSWDDEADAYSVWEELSDEEQDEWGDFELFWEAHGHKDGIERDNYRPDERTYVTVAHKWARRYNWAN